MNNKIYKTLANYKNKLENMGYNVMYIGLYGSQNYNLDDDESDIDAKAIVLPSLHDIIFRKVTSVTVNIDDSQIDVKDVLTFYNVAKKGNFSYLEVINKKLKVMDTTAISLCMEEEIPILVFNIHKKGNLKKLLLGEKIGSIVTN